MFYDEQQKEIATIKERTITVKLSDADCERLMEKCGLRNITVGKLIEDFITDLVHGTYSNSCELRQDANYWFDRRYYELFPEMTTLSEDTLFTEDTLLSRLLRFGLEPTDFLNVVTEIETQGYEITNPQENMEAESEQQAENGELAELKERLDDMIGNWKPDRKPDMKAEISHIKKWVEEKEQLLKGKEVPE